MKELKLVAVIIGGAIIGDAINGGEMNIGGAMPSIIGPMVGKKIRIYSDNKGSAYWHLPETVGAFFKFPLIWSYAKRTRVLDRE